MCAYDVFWKNDVNRTCLIVHISSSYLFVLHNNVKLDLYIVSYVVNKYKLKISFCLIKLLAKS